MTTNSLKPLTQEEDFHLRKTIEFIGELDDVLQRRTINMRFGIAPQKKLLKLGEIATVLHLPPGSILKLEEDGIKQIAIKLSRTLRLAEPCIDIVKKSLERYREEVHGTTDSKTK